MENSSLNCNESIPTVAEFYGGLHLEQITVLIVPAVFCFVTLALYVINLRLTLKYERRETKGNVATLLTIYPVRFVRFLCQKKVQKSLFKLVK